MVEMEKIIRNVYERKLIAIVRGMKADCCHALGRALVEGGINMMEVTFNQKDTDGFLDTVRAIASLKENLGDQLYIGAGTVLNRDQVKMARNAGATYIVTPVVDLKVIACAHDLDMVVMPGAMTPTEIESAYEAGADFVKVFPAGNLGPEYLKAVRAPLSHIPLLAVGGVNEKNVSAFLKAGAVGAGVGGNLINREWIAAGAFERITELARQYVEAVQI